MTHCDFKHKTAYYNLRMSKSHSVLLFVVLDFFIYTNSHVCCEGFINLHSLWKAGQRSDICKTSEFQVKKFPYWTFSDSLLLSSGFSIDSEVRNYVRQVRNAVFSAVEPTPLKTEARIVAQSEDVLMEILDLNVTDCENSTDFVKFVSGNHTLQGSTPLAHR